MDIGRANQAGTVLFAAERGQGCSDVSLAIPSSDSDRSWYGAVSYQLMSEDATSVHRAVPGWPCSQAGWFAYQYQCQIRKEFVAVH